MRKITEVTRRDIVDILINGFIDYETEMREDYYERQYFEEVPIELKMYYAGRLDEISFLNRLYNLKELPSTDSRFKDAEGDIRKHTIANDDWEYGWVFTDRRFQLCNGYDDEHLLSFICEIFHPAVRDEKLPWERFLEKLNSLLLFDGYEIIEKDHISGRTVYGWRELASGERVMIEQIENIKEAFNTDYVNTQVNLMYELINGAPHSAIGKAKELFEICCKTILDEQEITYSQELDLTQLMRLACDSLDLSPKKLKDGVLGKDIAARILGNLSNISQGMAELRNLYGDGHGKNKDFRPLPPRYAHLAVGASVAAVHFMWDTYQERKRKGTS